MPDSFDDLAKDLDDGRLPRPRTVAEQLALLIVIPQAAAALADTAYDDVVAALPTHPRDDDWESVADGLMDDRDSEAFYDPRSAASWLNICPMDTWFPPETARARAIAAEAIGDDRPTQSRHDPSKHSVETR